MSLYDSLLVQIGTIDVGFVGKMLDVLWPDDGKWYPARVAEVNVRAKKVKIEYDEGTDEGPQEWLALMKFREGTHWRHQDTCACFLDSAVS